MSNLIDTTYMLKDIISGDPDVDKREDYEAVTGEEIQKALDIILLNPKLSESEKMYYVKNSWRVHYRGSTPPPTIKDFLTPRWLGPTADSIYPYVKETLYKFWNPDARYRNFILSPSIGWGKEQLNTCVVYTPEGHKTIGELKIDDEVVTPNGKIAKVIKVFPQGVKDIYEITFKDGRKTYAGAKHLWKVSSCRPSKKWKNPWQIKTTEEIIKLGIFQKGKTAPKWKIPLTKPVYHKERDHYFSPYFIGVLIGDGHIPDKWCSINFTSTDNEIVEKMKIESPKDIVITHSENTIQYRITNGGLKIKEELRRLELLGKKSENKFIPKEYLFDSVENRISLLQGLMDTDGTVQTRRQEKGGTPRFDTISSQLRDDIIFLIRGLGGMASWSAHKERKNRNTNNIEYSISISFPNNDFPIFALARKQEKIDANFNRERKRSNTQALAIIDIKKTEPGEATCILLDDDDHLYLTDDYIVTHNSFAAVLSNLFVTTHLVHMKDPKRYFGLSPASIIAQVLISFNLDKASELLLEPFINILEAADRFERCRTKIILKKKNEEDSAMSKIYWTTASPTSALEFSNNVSTKLASSPAKLLGVTILMGTMSELSFFQDRGFSQDYIMRIFNDLKKRVYNRFPKSYWARTILDSSPNDIDNKIDDYIWNHADKDPTNLRIYGSMWEWQPGKFIDVNTTFPIFKGSSIKQPKILEPEEVKEYSPDEIVYPPEETRQLFEDDLIKSLKDLAGVPAGSSDKLIQNKDRIEEMFVPKLKNVYTYIKASYEDQPEGLLWNALRNDFFTEIHKGQWQFWRLPVAERFISVDLSKNKDTTGIAMCHMELDKQGNIIYVIDFSIPIVPDKSKVNIDAVKFFIKDLRDIGHCNILHVSFDQFQSESTMQFLERAEFEVENISVDRTPEPYLTFINLMNTHCVKMGRNLFMKNNLRSLRLAVGKGQHKTKVDHTIGRMADIRKETTDWEKSMLGFYAKDVSDPVVASVVLAQMYGQKPGDIWTEEIKTNVEVEDDMLKKILDKFSLKRMEIEKDLTKMYL